MAADLDGSEEQSSESLDGAEEFVDGEAAAVFTQVDGQIRPLVLHQGQQLLQLLTRPQALLKTHHRRRRRPHRAGKHIPTPDFLVVK